MSGDIYSLYETTNLINGKVYIGIHRETQWPDMDDYLGSGFAFKRAVAKYGKDNFKRKILCISNDPLYIRYLESQMVNENFIVETTNYNLSVGGVGPMIINEETRKRIGVSRKGSIPWNKGKSPSIEARKKMSESHKGKTHSNESKKKMSDIRKGRKQSPEHIKKRVESRSGFKHSTELRKKWSEERKGRTHSEETKAKMKRSQKDRWAERKKNKGSNQ